MKLPGYYSSGTFAKMAKVTVRTIRFYDKQNILKPSYTSPYGARFYTDQDFARLQQILLLKYLGFSLEDIREMTIGDTDSVRMQNSLKLQKKLIEDRIEQMQLVKHAIEDTVAAMEANQQIDWSQMLDLIHLTNMEKSLKTQYQNASNISARIRLHRDFSINPKGWFPWIFEHCHIAPGQQILELGCGSGALWAENIKALLPSVGLTLSDISEGMLRDAKRNLGEISESIRFLSFDCHRLPFEAEAFDRIIANHVLFYCEDIKKVCREVYRCLRPGGQFICSTYGAHHMQEIRDLVAEFDSRIVLSAQKLYNNFGLENGEKILGTAFSSITKIPYEDAIELDCAQPLIEYILSCHGNQNQVLLDRYKDFKLFVEKRVSHGFHITKEAGIFICTK